MKNRKVAWKRNLRFVPRALLKKAAQIGGPVVAGATLRLSKAQICAGLLSHLGIKDEKGAIQVPEAIIPPPDMGRWSRTNIDGHEIIRRDLPMVSKTFEAQTPNWGDWSKGSHTMYWDRDVYQRDLIPPRHLALLLEIIGRDPNADTYLLRCRSEAVLDPRARGFKDELLYNLNLLQENLGHADVYPAAATVADYLKTLHVTWEILPPGERDQNIAIILGHRRVSTAAQTALVERYDFLSRLRPRNFVSGSSGFQRYFGAQFADNLVVFENVEYGNAAYVMGADWHELSKLSRTELLSRAQRDFVRIVHVAGWKPKLRAVINQQLKPSPRKAA